MVGTFCYRTHYDITIDNDIARDVQCDIIMGHDVTMGTYTLLCIQMLLESSFIMYYYTKL